jgi:hypothetical protein
LQQGNGNSCTQKFLLWVLTVQLHITTSKILLWPPDRKSTKTEKPVVSGGRVDQRTSQCSPLSAMCTP